MNIWVKFYHQCPVSEKPVGIPENWPWLVKETDPEEAGWTQMTVELLNAHKESLSAQYDAWYQARESAESLDQYIDRKIDENCVFGEALVRRFARENVKAGITQRGLTRTVLDATEKIERYLKNGSLKEAIKEVRLIPSQYIDQHILTPERILQFRNEIETKEGVPLSTSWDGPLTWNE